MKLLHPFIRLIAALLIVVQFVLPLRVVLAIDETTTETEAGDEGVTQVFPENSIDPSGDPSDLSPETTAQDNGEEEENQLNSDEGSTNDADTSAISNEEPVTEDEVSALDEPTSSTSLLAVGEDVGTEEVVYAFSTSTPDECATESTEFGSTSPMGTSSDPFGCGGTFVEQQSTSTPGTSTSTTPEISENSGASGEDEIENGVATRTSPTIVTGTSVALANILNILNTNTINSSGYVLFSNFFGSTGDVDLRKNGSASSTGEGCTLENCSNDGNTIVNLSNDAFIYNLIRVQAGSGGNMIENGGDVEIKTGDAYAGLNLVNIANANFVNSNYVLIALNAFQDVYGDIVLPGLSKFLGSEVTTTPSVVELSENATVENELFVDASTGDNHAANTGSTTIITGTAHSTGNVFNQINTSLLGDTSVMILLRVHGEWFGDLSGAPAPLQLSSLGDGAFYLSSIIPGTGFATSGANNGPPQSLSLNGTSTAMIKNDVAVAALSGGNDIVGANTALITTGDAYAGANLINIANANVIGRNWLLAVINIFGNLYGDITFGRPDLWVGVQAEALTSFVSGNKVSYKVTLINNGDRSAGGVVASSHYQHTDFEILDSTLPFTTNSDGDLVWDIGDLPPGSATEFTYSARIKDAPPVTYMTNTVSAKENETDNNLEDNTDTVTILVNPAGYGGNGGGSVWVPESHQNNAATAGRVDPTSLTLAVMRRGTSTSITSLATSTQSIVITNPHETPIDSVVFTDVLRDPAGNIVDIERWDLGTIFPKEEVIIGYEVFFGPEATSGTYVLSSSIRRPGAIDKVYEANGTILLMVPLSVAPPTVEPVKRSLPEIGTTNTEEVFLVEEHDPSLPLISVAHAKGESEELARGEAQHISSILLASFLLVVLVLAFLARSAAFQEKALAVVRRWRETRGQKQDDR